LLKHVLHPHLRERDKEQKKRKRKAMWYENEERVCTMNKIRKEKLHYVWLRKRKK